MDSYFDCQSECADWSQIDTGSDGGTEEPSASAQQPSCETGTGNVFVAHQLGDVFQSLGYIKHTIAQIQRKQLDQDTKQALLESRMAEIIKQEVSVQIAKVQNEVGQAQDAKLATFESKLTEMLLKSTSKQTEKLERQIRALQENLVQPTGGSVVNNSGPSPMSREKIGQIIAKLKDNKNHSRIDVNGVDLKQIRICGNLQKLDMSFEWEEILEMMATGGNGVNYFRIYSSGLIAMFPSCGWYPPDIFGRIMKNVVETAAPELIVKEIKLTVPKNSGTNLTGQIQSLEETFDIRLVGKAKLDSRYDKWNYTEYELKNRKVGTKFEVRHWHWIAEDSSGSGWESFWINQK